jgi:hypothetical protein
MNGIGTIQERGCNGVENVGIGRWMRSAGETHTAFCRNNSTNSQAVVLDNYINDVSKNQYVPISQVIDIVSLNQYLNSKYNICVIDKSCARFTLLSVFYGNKETKIDITNEISKSFVRNGGLVISKYTDFNRIRGDPAYGKQKYIFLKYNIAMDLPNPVTYVMEETYDEVLKKDIVIDFSNTECEFTFADLQSIYSNSYRQRVFEDILMKIEYLSMYQIAAEKTIRCIDRDLRINVIHLRVEPDAIEHWSKMNNMSPTLFRRTIENKYIELIQKYMQKTETIIILSDSVVNNVVDFLLRNEYNFIIPEKQFTNRHLNAIVDMLISKTCNNIFIGCYNFNKKNGSTFSYYCQKQMSDSVQKVMIDIDFILEPEMSQNIISHRII